MVWDIMIPYNPKQTISIPAYRAIKLSMLIALANVKLASPKK
jgi:hypothetical protein